MLYTHGTTATIRGKKYRVTYAMLINRWHLYILRAGKKALCISGYTDNLKTEIIKCKPANKNQATPTDPTQAKPEPSVNQTSA